MSREIDEIRRKIFGQMNDMVCHIIPGTVTEVNEDEFTCTLRVDDSVDYYDVRLRGLVDGSLQGLALIPRIGSVVLACPIGRSNELFVCQFTEIDKVIFTDNNLSMMIDTEKLEVIRDDMKITSDAGSTVMEAKDTKIVIDTESIELKSGSSTITITQGGLAMKKDGAGLKKTLESMLDAICRLTVPTGVGPSGVPINVSQFQQIKAEVSQYMEG